MSDAIRCLESLGAAPATGTAGTDGVRARTAASKALPAAQRRAMLERDPVALNELAGGRGTMRCLIISPDPGQSGPTASDGLDRGPA